MRRIYCKITGQIFNSIREAVYTVHCFANQENDDSVNHDDDVKSCLDCPLWHGWHSCATYISQHPNEVAELFGYEFIDDGLLKEKLNEEAKPFKDEFADNDILEDKLLIVPRHNWLGEYTSNMSNKHLCAVFKEIVEYRQEGVLGGSLLRDFAKTYAENSLNSVSECIRLTEDAVLFEMSRRFHNSLVK